MPKGVTLGAAADATAGVYALPGDSRCVPYSGDVRVFVPCLALGAAFVGCAADAAPLDVRLRLASDPRCAPGAPIGTLRVDALGDFPASDARTVELLDPAAGPALIERFPEATRSLAVTAEAPGWRGLGLGPLGTRDLLVQPENAPCVVPDPLLAPAGRGIGALPDGSLVLAGGRAALGFGDRRVLRYVPGDTLATPLGEGLVERRFEPSVAVAGGRVFVLGGGADATGGGLDTFEVFDASGRLSASPIPLGGPRREAGAVAASAQTVLVAGGRVFPAASGEAGAPLDTVLRIDARSLALRALAPLPVPRARPTLLRLDDGAVLLVAGAGPGGAELTDVLVFDAELEEFVASGERVAPFVGAAQAVALPGARAVVFGADRPAALELFERVPPEASLRPVLRRTRLDLGAVLPPLTGARAAALDDGRLFLTGTDAEGAARAFALDLGALGVDALPDDSGRAAVVRAGSEGVDAWEVDRAPERALVLPGGLVVELDEGGASLRRPALASPFGNPPASLFLEDLRAGGPGQWAQEGAALVARRVDARLELPALRFADVDVELRAEGEAELLLRPAGAPRVSVVFRDLGASRGEQEVAVGACRLTVPRGALLRVARRGGIVRLLPAEAGAFEGRGCPAPELGGDFAGLTDTAELGLGVLVGVALRAQPGARVTAFRVRRVASE